MRSWAWRIPPSDRWQRGWPRGTSAERFGEGTKRQSLTPENQKKTWKQSQFHGEMDSDIQYHRKIQSCHRKISFNIQEDPDIHHPIREVALGEPRAEHVNFLTTWDPKSTLDSKAFRLASVSDPWLIFGS